MVTLPDLPERSVAEISLPSRVYLMATLMGVSWVLFSILVYLSVSRVVLVQSLEMTRRVLPEASVKT